MSWIHEYDFVKCIQFILEHKELAGVYNVAAPNPIPDKEFMQTMRNLMKIKIGLPAAKWMLEAGAVFLRTETELILKSRRVIPTKLLNAGFKFKFEKVTDAIDDLLKSSRTN